MPGKIKFYSKKRIIENYIKKYFRKIILFPIPDLIIKKIMERNYTDMGTELSNGCNANCSFCAYRFQKRQRKVTNLEMFKKAIDNYSSDGGGTVSFTPVIGDPLIDKKIIEKFNYCMSKPNINSVYLYTNGIFLDNYDMHKFLTSGLNRLAISIFFGSRELYKKYFGVDQYDRVIKNIKDIARINNDNDYNVKITLHLRVEMPEEKWNTNPDFLEIRDLVGVCPSRDMEGEINIGDLKKNTLKEIWQGDKIKKFRDDWKKGILPNVCKNCDRYESIDSYIKKKKYTIFRTQVLKRILKLDHFS